mmetsp:Transcript_52881/g.113344  ORF Transcript_52881/g.113344 Transcript_52881/m.113344 type:complete len:942 (-) Transcript_52881:55-2880(-)
MTSSETYDQIAKTLGPELAKIRRKAEAAWPTIEPDMLLLNWLCYKHGLEPPAASLARRELEEDAKAKEGRGLRSAGVASKGDEVSLPALQTARSPPLVKPPSKPPSRPGSGRTKASSLAPTPLPADSLRAATGTPGMLSLGAAGRFQTLVEADVSRHFSCSGRLKTSTDQMREAIADRRVELRGQFLSKVPLLSQEILTAEEGRCLAGNLCPLTFTRGQNIFKEGEIGDKLYIIERGSCDALKTTNQREVIVGQLPKGAFFGEIAVMYDMPRTATVRAATDVTVLFLSREDLFKTISVEKLEKMRIVARTQVMTSIPLLAPLTAAQKVRIAQRMKSETWSLGSQLASEVHTTLRLYVIEQGRCLMKVQNEKQLPVFMQESWKDGGITVGPGQYFGMRGLLFGAPVGFNITAASDNLKTLSVSYSEILDACDPDEREEIAGAMHKAMQTYLLRQVPQLAQMPEDSFNYVQANVKEVHLKKWSVVLSKGAPADAVYVLERGKLVEHNSSSQDLCNSTFLEVDSPERSTPGEFFGVECLTDKDTVINNTVVALTDCTLLRVDPGIVWSVLSEERSRLCKIPLFSNQVLSTREQYMLVQKLTEEKFASGCNIVAQGEMGDRLYIIETGVCDAKRICNGVDVVMGQIRRGAFFGEISVVYDMPRTATIRSATEVTALSISRADLLSTIGASKLEKMRNIAINYISNEIPLLARLPAKMKTRIAESLRSDSWPATGLVVSAEQPTQRLYIIEAGHCISQVKMIPAGLFLDPSPKTMHFGEYFGMQGLCAGSPMGYDISAIEGVKTLSISLEEILDLAANEKERGEASKAIVESLRLTRLQQLPPFAELGEDALLSILAQCGEVQVKASQDLLAVDDSLDAAYVLERGTMAESFEVPGKPAERIVSSMPGSCFPVDCLAGEFERTSTSLVAVSDCSLLRIPRALLQPA